MWMSKAPGSRRPCARTTASTPLTHETPAIVRYLAESLLLCVDADERGWPGWVVVRTVDQDLAVEGHLTGRSRFPLLPLASRRVDRGLHRPDARPLHVEGDLVGPTEVIADGYIPLAVTLLRFSVLVMIAGAAAAPQLNEVPGGQTARNCSLTVGSGSSVSGDSKSRVLCTNSVPCTIEPSAHVWGTAQKA